MAHRVSQAEWTGDLIKGRGEVSFASERLRLAYTPAWLQEGAATNPEELLAAAHASSFAMALQAAFFEPTTARAPSVCERSFTSITATAAGPSPVVTLRARSPWRRYPRMRDIFQSEFENIAKDAARTARCRRRWLAWKSRSTLDRLVSDRADPASIRPRPTAPRGEDDGRKRRALEGELIGRIRRQARRVDTPGAVAQRRADKRRT